MDEPTDAEIENAIRAASPGAAAALRAALAALVRAHGPKPVTPWSDARGSGTPDDPTVIPFPLYAPEVATLLSALDDVEAVPLVDWMSWDGQARVDSPDGVARADVADVARLLTAIVRGERFGDGVVAHALAQGTLVAAATRIADVAGSDAHGGQDGRTPVPRSAP